MDKFKYVTSSKQVYGEDLNLILMKTPPRIFKSLLLGIVGVIALISLFLFAVKVDPREEFRCVVKPQSGSLSDDSVQIAFVSDDLIDDKDIKQIVVDIKSSPPIKNTPILLGTSMSDFEIDSDWYLNEEPLSDREELNLHRLGQARSVFTYTLSLKNDFNIRRSAIGTVVIHKRKIRLYQKFF